MIRRGRVGDSGRRQSWPPRWWLVWVALIVLVAAIGIPAAIRAQHRWETWCRGQGGTVSSHTNWTTSYDRQGNSHSDSNTTYYCITGDGRLLGVR